MDLPAVLSGRFVHTVLGNKYAGNDHTRLTETSKEGFPMHLFISLALIVSLASVTLAADGVVNIKSSHTVEKTANRLESILKEKGMTVFGRIDHGAGAQKVGKTLRPTELLIFGNPKVGTPLMLCQQTIALDLPQKALVWEDGEGTVWLSYNDPLYLAQRHDLKGCEDVLKKVAGALNNFAKAATTP